MFAIDIFYEWDIGADGLRQIGLLDLFFLGIWVLQLRLPMMTPHYVTVYQIGADQAISSFEYWVRFFPVVFGVGWFATFGSLIFVATRLRRGWARWFVGTAATLLCVLGVFLVRLVIPHNLHRDTDALMAYQKGDYQTVEGVVTNFDPMPYEGHKLECFSVEGKRFCYSDYSIEPGFRNAASHGGPIRSGLQVRIAFISTVRRNAILRLEVTEKPTESAR